MPIWTPEQVQKECDRLVGRGIETMARMYANLVRQTLSIPAPRRRAVAGQRSRNPGTIYYVATTPATKGAPPRKLSGRLRASIAVDFNASINVARVGTNVIYGRVHEEGDHAWLLPTLETNRMGLQQILGQEITSGVTTKHV